MAAKGGDTNCGSLAQFATDADLASNVHKAFGIDRCAIDTNFVMQMDARGFASASHFANHAIFANIITPFDGDSGRWAYGDNIMIMLDPDNLAK